VAAYALVMWLDEDMVLRVGALGEVLFHRGCYVYAGSAIHGMASRVAHHIRHDKRLHWHVDYLTRKLRIVAAWCDPGEGANECLWSHRLAGLRGANRFPRGFGSSDCRCPGHLVYMRGRPDLATLLHTLYSFARVCGG